MPGSSNDNENQQEYRSALPDSFKKILTPDHIGKWEHSFSAFKTSRALKMTESSVPIQSSKKACLGLKLPCAQRPLVSQHRGKQQALREVPPANCWTWQRFTLLPGQEKAGGPHVLATALLTEKHPSPRRSPKRRLELRQLPVLLCVLVVKKSKADGRPASLRTVSNTAF